MPTEIIGRCIITEKRLNPPSSTRVLEHTKARTGKAMESQAWFTVIPLVVVKVERSGSAKDRGSMGISLTGITASALGDIKITTPVWDVITSAV